jgi:hypothetical protein
MNRLSYDACAYTKALGESVAPLDYMLDPIKYEHCSPCRPELGIVGGTAVSHINGNMVDLENDLRGGNRPNTHCPSYKYVPAELQGGRVQGKEYIKPVCHPVVDTTPLHLRSCQFQDFPAVPLPPVATPFSCPAPGR